MNAVSGAGTNLKAGHIFVHFFWRFGERFLDGQYILVGFLLVPRCLAICKSVGTAPLNATINLSEFNAIKQ